MSTKYYTPPNYLEKITEMYAYVSVDEGGEGLIAASMPTPDGVMMIPFVCADKERMESLKLMAVEIGKQSNRKIKLIRLSVREELEDIN